MFCQMQPRNLHDNKSLISNGTLVATEFASTHTFIIGQSTPTGSVLLILPTVSANIPSREASSTLSSYLMGNALACHLTLTAATLSQPQMGKSDPHLFIIIKFCTKVRLMNRNSSILGHVSLRKAHFTWPSYVHPSKLSDCIDPKRKIKY